MAPKNEEDERVSLPGCATLTDLVVHQPADSISGAQKLVLTEIDVYVGANSSSGGSFSQQYEFDQTINSEDVDPELLGGTIFNPITYKGVNPDGSNDALYILRGIKCIIQ